MGISYEAPFQKALDAVESLPLDDREEVIEILRKRLAEDRREELIASLRIGAEDMLTTDVPFTPGAMLTEVEVADPKWV